MEGQERGENKAMESQGKSDPIQGTSQHSVCRSCREMIQGDSRFCRFCESYLRDP